MPKAAHNYHYGYYNESIQSTKTYFNTDPYTKKSINAGVIRRSKPASRTKMKRVKVVRKDNPIKSFFKYGFALFLGGIVLPYCFSHFTKAALFNPLKNKNIKTDYNYILNPTLSYMNNEYFMNQPLRVSAEVKKPIMQPLFESDRMTMLEARLGELMQSYKSIHPSIYVWEYENGKYANVNADEIFPTASIIKIPVLIEMFRSIEAGQFKLYDRMVMAEYYRTGGSGSLQFKPRYSEFTMDDLARHMIEESDNTSTNMIMAKIGGKHSVNRALKNWGMKKTHIENWLPDLGGGNVSTAREMSTMLYNINNESLLNINSRESIIDYMTHVKNNRLIKAGIPENAQFIHKTGDIGSMLGDAGIVYAPDGKRYIVTIFAKRPYNSPQGKEFIMAASKIIYDYVIYGKV